MLMFHGNRLYKLSEGTSLMFPCGGSLAQPVHKLLPIVMLRIWSGIFGCCGHQAKQSHRPGFEIDKTSSVIQFLLVKFPVYIYS